jgi:hypothetical protein
MDRLTLVDISGRELKSIEFSSLNYSLSVLDLSKGVYFIEIH